jgi:undecaprenyl diphosphate synthase
MDSPHTVPKCIGLIMDGNRRWAKARGLPTHDGHTAGRDVLIDCVRWAKKAGVETLVFFAFSTENWKRTEEEVGYLMKLLENTLRDEFQELKKENVRMRFIGERDLFSETLQTLMTQWEEETGSATGGTVAIALSYGGRSEILRAVERLHVRGYEQGISEEDFSRHLDTTDLPDPDIIIRTGGERRLSGFLTWQSVYSELFFLDTLWPDFSKEEFSAVLEEFAVRKRNFGK